MQTFHVLAKLHTSACQQPNTETADRIPFDFWSLCCRVLMREEVSKERVAWRFPLS